MKERVDEFLDRVISWANKKDSILGISLVGSYARDEARLDSDVDLVVICDKPTELLTNNDWLSTFGEVVSNRHGDYGLVQSKHILYKDGLKIEYGITTLEWAKTQPIDPETRKVVMDGMRILYDPKQVFKQLEEAIEHLK